MKSHIINGHFDPLTLSIYENAPSQDWRNFDPKVTVGEIGSLGNIQREKNIEFTEIDWHFDAFLANSHEADHFIRHASSGLGLFYTILLNIRFHTIKQLLTSEDSNDFWLKNQLNLVNDIIKALFTNDPSITQEQATFALNYFYKAFFGITEEIFIARDPKLPAYPGGHTGYTNILEASAVFGELSYLFFAKLDYETINNKIRKNRDYGTYLWLVDYLMEELRYPSLAIMVLRYALDIHLPLITAPYYRKIYFDEIHPAHKLVHLTQDYKEIFSTNELYKEITDERIYQFYVDFIAKDQLLKLDSFIQHKYGFHTWNTNIINDYDSSLDNFISNFGERNKEAFQSIVERSKGIFKHAFNAYNILKKRKIDNHTLAFLPECLRTGAVAPQEHEAVDIENNAYALFSIHDGYFNSIYNTQKDHNEIYGIMIYSDNRIQDYILDGMDKNTIIQEMLAFPKWREDVLQKAHEKMILDKINSYMK